MGTNSTLRWRRTAAQRDALAQVEREIRAADDKSRCRYLRDFTNAFRSYERVLTRGELLDSAQASGILLVGDYHALPASQRFAAQLLEELARLEPSRPLVLALEAVFSRHQRWLDAYFRGEISPEELCLRLRFQLEWGYDWQPYGELLEAGRRHARAIYGLDRRPRSSLRSIALRDRHAAIQIEQIRDSHPRALIVVLFGESHLAPNHLPAQLRARLPQERILTVLQNVDSLYWQAAGERCERVEAVQVAPDVLCAFTSTPLEKYESYRLCIERWRVEGSARPNLAPSIYNLIEALLRFLRMDCYSPSTGPQPETRQALLPRVCFRESFRQHEQLLRRRGISRCQRQRILASLHEQGICHVPPLNLMLVREFHLEYGSEEAARFVYRACQGRLLSSEADEQSTPPCPDAGPAQGSAEDDSFYGCILEHALAYFGSRILCPARAPVRGCGIDLLCGFSHRQDASSLARRALHSRGEEAPLPAARSIFGPEDQIAPLARQLGYMLGSALYDAYIRGSIGKRFVRGLFLRPVRQPGSARAACEELTRKIHLRAGALGRANAG